MMHAQINFISGVLTHTHMMLWCMGMVSSAQLCVGGHRQCTGKYVKEDDVLLATAKIALAKDDLQRNHEGSKIRATFPRC